MASGAKIPVARRITRSLTAKNTFGFPKKLVTGGSREERSVSPTPSTPSTSHPDPLWAPIVDMAEIQRPRAIWLREAREACARVKEERTSAGNGHASDHTDVKLTWATFVGVITNLIEPTYEIPLGMTFSRNKNDIRSFLVGSIPSVCIES